MISMNDSLETVFEEYQTRLRFLFLFIEGSTWRCVDKAFSFCRYSEYWNLLTLISFSGTDFVQSIWRFQLGSEHEECSIFLLFRSFSRNTTQINIPDPPCSSCCSDKRNVLCICIGDWFQSEYNYTGFSGGPRCSFMLYALDVRSCNVMQYLQFLKLYF